MKALRAARHHPVFGAIQRVRLRLATQRAIDTLAWALVGAGVAAVGLVFAWRLEWLTEGDLLYIATPALGAAVFVAAVFALALPVPVPTALERIDRAGKLTDRAGSAFEFMQAGPLTDFQRAQLDDAARHLTSFRARSVVRFKTPEAFVWAIFAGVAAVLASLADFSKPPTPDPIAEEKTLPPSLPRDVIAEGQTETNEIAREAEVLKSEELKAVARELERIYRDAERGNLSRRDLLARVNELERRMNEARRAALDPELKALAAISKKLLGNRLTKELAKALKEGNLAKAREELEKLAKQLRDKPPDKATERKLEQLMREMAKTESKAVERMKAEAESLKKKASEAESKGAAGADAKRERERKREQLERERERRENGAPGQMSKEMQRAADQLAKGDRQGASKSLERAAEKLGEAERRAGEQALRQRASGAIGEAKEALRQGGNRPKSVDDFKQRAAGHDHREGKECPACHGQKGGSDGKSQAGRRGERLAREGRASKPGEKGGDGERGGKPGQGADTPKGGKPSGGAGAGSDEALLGESTELKSTRKEERLGATEGRGETVSEVIAGGAQKGFTSRRYRNVYAAYRRVAEEVMENDRRIPHSFKRLIQRYMELIRPR
ncbi:MAG: hypothetical protein HYY84_15500 [Deltaproteobacteria bacterium]|nr:hypothetical protein [Deltaproteobacteria bacterium]